MRSLRQIQKERRASSTWKCYTKRLSLTEKKFKRYSNLTKMTNHFSFTRLYLLIKKQAIENLRLYALASTALALLLAIVFIFWYFNARPNFHEESLYMIYIFGLIVAGGLFASF